MLKFILYLFYFLSFSKDPFIDFRKYKTYKLNKSLKPKNNFKFLGFAKESPILVLKGTLIYPLENTSFKVVHFNRSCIRFYYKDKEYKVCR